MQALLEYFIKQSITYSFIAVLLVAFLESLAFVGLVLPGTVMMAGIGGLIGSGEVNFWQAWMAAVIGCLLGEWFSFWLGWRFKEWLHSLPFFKKNKALLKTTENALLQHSMLTILGGRFVGPIRPLVPMLAGMLDLPVVKFIVPNIIGSLFWPLFYFLPGMLAAAAIDIPAYEGSNCFKWLLLMTGLLVWLTAWFGWRLHSNEQVSFNRLISHFPRSYLFWLGLVILGITLIIALISHPLMRVYGKILLKIISP